jgi:hypothetical protein
MRKWKAAVLFALILWSAVAAPPASATDVIGFLVVAVSGAAPDSVVDIGKKGPSPGDMNLWSEPLFDGNVKERIGTSSGYCVQVSASATELVRQCNFTLTMKSGAVCVASNITGRTGPFVGAVIGGTGEYANARGEVKYGPNEDFTKWSYDLRISK